MELPFGKRVPIGGFYVLKRSRALSSKELKKLRSAQGIPDDVQKHLGRGTLPYITVGTITDSWRIEFCCGMMVFNAINEIPVAIDADGNLSYYGTGYRNLGNIINGWFAYTSTVGDEQYQAECIKAMQDYLNRMSEKNKEPLSAEENEKILDELEATGKHKNALIEMSSVIKEDSDGNK